MSTSLQVVQVLGEASDVRRLIQLVEPVGQQCGFTLVHGAVNIAQGDRPLVILAGDASQRQLTELLGRMPAANILVVGSDSAASAAWCLRRGASEYLCWQTLHASPAVLENLFRTLIHVAVPSHILRSAASTKVYRLARRVASSEVPVLIHGDSGSGKEVLARFVHSQSLRSNGPFVAVNCAAIPENMLEATLFGHEKGAFTGADRKRDGKFVAACEGTLLLDEITEMPIELQAKLLRAIQEREIEPLGARHAIATNVRVIATSNRNLKQAIDEGRLRLDLYYRLNVFPLQLPTLVQRCEDILPLAEQLARRHRTVDTPVGRESDWFDEGASAALLRHDWPGNIRELENRIQRALILADEQQISAADLGLEGATVRDKTEDRARPNGDSSFVPIQNQQSNIESGGDFKARLDAQESALILQALSQHGGRRKATAASLGMSERTLRYRLRRMRDSGVYVT